MKAFEDSDDEEIIQPKETPMETQNIVSGTDKVAEDSENAVMSQSDPNFLEPTSEPLFVTQDLLKPVETSQDDLFTPSTVSTARTLDDIFSTQPCKTKIKSVNDSKTNFPHFQ